MRLVILRLQADGVPELSRPRIPEIKPIHCEGFQLVVKGSSEDMRRFYWRAFDPEGYRELRWDSQVIMHDGEMSEGQVFPHILITRQSVVLFLLHEINKPSRGAYVLIDNKRHTDHVGCLSEVPSKFGWIEMPFGVPMNSELCLAPS